MNKNLPDNQSNFLLYTANDGKVNVEVFLKDETIRLTQKAIGNLFGKDCFEELLKRIREIRTSERRFYQKITDIYALSADYDKNAPVTKEFFASVQNKLHWAITGKTAAEIIYDSADATKIHMGLTNWKQAPDGKIIIEVLYANENNYGGEKCGQK